MEGQPQHQLVDQSQGGKIAFHLSSHGARNSYSAFAGGKACNSDVVVSHAAEVVHQCLTRFTGWDPVVLIQ